MSPPSVETLLVRLEGVERLIDERDRRYEERFKAQESAVRAALAAQEAFSTATGAASKEAVQKAETAQKGVNERSNEFRGQLADQAATLMPRKEAESSLSALSDALNRDIGLMRADITSLRESRSEGTGEVHGRMSQQQFVVMAVGLLVSALTIGAAVVSVTLFFKR